MCDFTLSDDETELFGHLSALSVDSLRKRDLCDKCRRPPRVCWCQHLPKEPLSVTTTLYILQHPYEERRTLKTAPMLHHGLEDGKCLIWKGKKFNPNKNVALKQILQSSNSILLYPGPSAVALPDFVRREASSGSSGPYNLILLDGTWPQARGIYAHNPCLHGLKQVRLVGNKCSSYVIRTQPTDSSLSTVESAAVCIAALENRPEILQMLTRPLQALCDYQLQHGAVKHHSKQYLQSRGLLKKQQPHEQSRLVPAMQRGCKVDEAKPLTSKVKTPVSTGITNSMAETSEVEKCQDKDEGGSVDTYEHVQHTTDASLPPEQVCGDSLIVQSSTCTS